MGFLRRFWGVNTLPPLKWGECVRVGLAEVSEEPVSDIASRRLAFGRSLDAFEAQLRRMCGEDDGVTDALFRFTRPVTGGAFWCPPLTGEGRLDLSAIGLSA